MITGSALTTALAGLGAARAGIDLASRNIANADVAGYTRKVQAQTTSVDGAPSVGPVQRLLDAGLQKTSRDVAAKVGMLDAQHRYASQITLQFGTPADAASLSGLTSALGDAFQTLSASPESDASYTAVIDAASRLARGVNALYDQAEQVASNARSELDGTIEAANADLGRIDTLNKKIIAGAGSDVTELEDQRDPAIAELARKLDITTFARPDGGVSVYTKNGTMLVDVEAGTLSSQPVAGPGPVDLFVQLAAGPAASTQVFPRSGAIAGLLEVTNLRVPTLQAQLDSFADGLTTAIAATGVALFDDAGTLYDPGTNPLQPRGFGNRIAVTSSITQASIHDGDGITLGVTTGPGDTTYIDAVLGVLQSDQIDFTDYSTVPPTPLPKNSLAGQAAHLVIRQSDNEANLENLLQTETATQTAIDNGISAVSGINVDEEVSHLLQLQQAYATNARIVSVTQTMFDTLLEAVRGG